MERPIDCRAKVRTRRAAPIALSVLALYGLLPSVAKAQAAPPAERAQQAFDEGRRLMDQERFSEACAKFAESETLQPGGGTLLNLGICRQKEGRTATAFKVLSEALAKAKTDGRNDRVATAQKHLDELTPELSQVTLKLWPLADASQVRLEVDAEPLAPSLLGQPFPLDPGKHVVRASEPGHETWTFELTLAAHADAQTVEVPALAATTPAPAPRPAPLQPPSTPSPAAPAPRQPAAALAPKRSDKVLGYAFLAGGGVAVGTSIFFGARAFSLRSRSNQYFDGAHCTRQSCVDDWNGAKFSARVSDVAAGLAAVALGVGAYVLLRPASAAQGQAAWVLSVGANQSGARAAASHEF